MHDPRPGGDALPSMVYFRSGGRLAPITEVDHLKLELSSSGEAWRGLHLELGSAERWDGEDLTVAGHFVSMNVSDAPLQIRLRRAEDGAWMACLIDPGAFWIVPEGRPFSLRVDRSTAWSGAILDGGSLDQAMAGHVEVDAAVNARAPMLEHLFRALIENLRAGDAPPQLTQALVRGALIAFGAACGRVRPASPRVGLTPGQISRLDDWIAERMHLRISVEDMANEAALSASLFARAFKRATGCTPWERVIQLRLQRAQNLLAEGCSVCATATDCGFFDQAHLARVFRQRLGMSPSEFARRHPRLTDRL